MRWGLFLIMLAVSPYIADDVRAEAMCPDTMRRPSDERFINQVFHTVVDSSFDHYFLFEEAAPCSFIKYDYDEWLRYALRETVNMYTLNELSRHAYEERASHGWEQDSLANARCIDKRVADSILDPLRQIRSDTLMRKGKRKRKMARLWLAWARRPAEDRTVFYFSRPVFTDDGQYALLDMDIRCDDRECGQGAICLFRREPAGWKLVGKSIRWGQ